MAFLYIDRDECIGDSLGKINDNAYNFDLRLITQNSQLTSLSTQFAAVSAQTVILKDVKAAGAAGGTFNAGSWFTRDLNTLSAYPAGISTLGSNIFTLPPGKWLVRASAPAYRAKTHQIRLYDVTNNIEIYGTVEFTPDNSSSCVTRSYLDTIVSPAVTTQYRIDHKCSSTESGDGFGIALPAGWGTSYTENVFTTVICTKIG